MDNVEIYCDGACSGNPGPGAWAYIIFENGKEISSASGFAEQTTNNRMELCAVIMAINSTSGDIKLVVDSKYVKDGINSWIHKWKKNNWKTSAGTDVKNKDLWEELDKVTKERKIEWVWQKGHAGGVHDKVDKLARSVLE